MFNRLSLCAFLNLALPSRRKQANLQRQVAAAIATNDLAAVDRAIEKGLDGAQPVARAATASKQACARMPPNVALSNVETEWLSAFRPIETQKRDDKARAANASAAGLRRNSARQISFGGDCRAGSSSKSGARPHVAPTRTKSIRRLHLAQTTCWKRWAAFAWRRQALLVGVQFRSDTKVPKRLFIE